MVVKNLCLTCLHIFQVERELQDKAQAQQQLEHQQQLLKARSPSTTATGVAGVQRGLMESVCPTMDSLPLKDLVQQLPKLLTSPDLAAATQSLLPNPSSPIPANSTQASLGVSIAPQTQPPSPQFLQQPLPSTVVANVNATGNSSSSSGNGKVSKGRNTGKTSRPNKASQQQPVLPPPPPPQQQSLSSTTQLATQSLSPQAAALTLNLQTGGEPSFLTTSFSQVSSLLDLLLFEWLCLFVCVCVCVCVCLCVCVCVCVCVFLGCLQSSKMDWGKILLWQHYMLAQWDRQCYMLAQSDRSCTLNLLPHPITVNWHWASQSWHWLYNAGVAIRVPIFKSILVWIDQGKRGVILRFVWRCLWSSFLSAEAEMISTLLWRTANLEGVGLSYKHECRGGKRFIHLKETRVTAWLWNRDFELSLSC